MSFAGNTLITLPSGDVEIAQLRAGDGLLCAGLDFNWGLCTVKMAEEVSGGASVVVTLSGAPTLVVSPDQLLVVLENQLMPAHALEPGVELMGLTRRQFMITGVARESSAAMYHLATSAAAGIDGHLVVANGVIAADFDLQAANGS